LPRKEGWQIMTQMGREMLQVPVPFEIIKQLNDHKVKMEEG